MPLPAGHLLSHYRIQRRLGQGGMGTVYLAVDTRLGREVAVKVVEPEADPVVMARFRREAATIAALKHPHIAVLLDVGDADGTSFLVMEHIEGEPLSRAIQRGRLRWMEVLEHARDLASALAHAHQAGVLHRDIKPGNIMVSPVRGAILLDFGVARWVGFRPGADTTEAPTEVALRLSRTGSMLGTVLYSSPEQIAEQALDGRSDLFQLGLVLYEALAGRHPFLGPTAVDIQHAILRERPRPLREIVDDVPEELARLVGKLLEKDPEFRYPDARALEVDVRVLLRDSTSEIPLPPAGSRRPDRRRRLRFGFLAMAVLALAGVVGWGLMRGPSSGGATPRRVLPLSDGTSADLSPSFSPDGASIVFSSDRGGQRDLWVRLLAGGSPVRITDTPEAESDPDWSPDGSRVAFTRRSTGEDAPGIYVMPALGGEARKLVANGTDPAWSPDGEWIAYARIDEGWHCLDRVRVSRPEDVRRITACEEGFFHRRPSWTPDGGTLVFNRSPGGAIGQLFRVDVDGGPPRPITADPEGTINLAAAVTPDGRYAVHVSDRGGAENLWRIPVRGGTAERITSGPGRDMSPAVSPDGQRIVFANEPPGSDLVRFDSRDGSRTVLAAFRGGEAWAPSLSPDGRWVAVARKVPGRPWEMVLVPAEGGPPRTVVDGVGDVFWVRFNPVNGSLVFHARAADRNRIGSVEPDGTGLRWLVEDGSYPDVAPDGERIAYVREAAGVGEIILRGPGEVERTLLHGATLPRFSPDGSTLVVARSRSYVGGIGVIDLTSGETHWITGSGTWPTWTPDGRIAYADLGTRGAQVAFVVGPRGGTPEPLGTGPWTGSHAPFAVDTGAGGLVTTVDASGKAMLWIAEY
ncbi:MAG: protein kinase [Acidobacteriota bacterium]|jgi:Tol biopolymer transport system component/predicted Ser/Thr protein kinase